ncbi:hypothetical protein ACIHFE_01500 [Streptomyces sp. NPDC052396]|uniref:hypothetical protein n=1 Tax=Streptomyces sp. NPDC052396 TaxID=3365689 RepID=UPI0037D92E79
MSPHPFLDRTAGVLALVTLTAAVVWGLIAAGCLIGVPLTARARLLAQAVHRALGVGALGFLAVHIAVKTAEGHAAVTASLLPFSSGALLGLGALAGYLLVLAAATGALRSAFVGRGRLARHWRALHSCAYPAWCAALPHGLNAGRAPAAWVPACYALCLAAVAAALTFRVLAGSPGAGWLRARVQAAMGGGAHTGRRRRTGADRGGAHAGPARTGRGGGRGQESARGHDREEAGWHGREEAGHHDRDGTGQAYARGGASTLLSRPEGRG